MSATFLGLSITLLGLSATFLGLSITLLRLSASHLGLSITVPKSSAAIPGLSATMSRLSIAILVLSAAMPGLCIAIPKSFTAMPGLFATVSGSSAAVYGLSTTMPKLSATVSKLSTPTSASVIVPGSSSPIHLSTLASISVSMPGSSALIFFTTFAPVPRFSSLSAFPNALVPRSSPLPFHTLFLLKIPMPNLTIERQRLNNTICGWSGRNKKISSAELCSRQIKRAALKEVFSPRAYLFPPLFLSSSISKKRKFDKIFINTQPLANDHANEKVGPEFAGCGRPITVKLKKP